MKKSNLLLAFLIVLFTCSCQQEEGDITPEIDLAEKLYGVWNRTTIGFSDCEISSRESRQFVDGSAGFERGGFYTTYSISNGRDAITTVRFQADADSVTFLNVNSTWSYKVIEDELVLKTNAANGCVQYQEFILSKTAF